MITTRNRQRTVGDVRSEQLSKPGLVRINGLIVGRQVIRIFLGFWGFWGCFCWSILYVKFAFGTPKKHSTFKMGPYYTSKWNYNPYKWPYKWVRGGYNPYKWRFITLLMPARGPSCSVLRMIPYVVRRASPGLSCYINSNMIIWPCYLTWGLSLGVFFL